MFTPTLFRERALERQSKPDPLDDLLRVTAPHEWFVLTGFVIAFAVTCIWAAFGSLDRSLTTNGVILKSGERHTVLSGLAGAVVEIPVQVNDNVAEGAPIARLLLPELETRLAAARARVAMLQGQAGRDGAAAGPGSRLEAARRQLAELTAHRAGAAITAPYSGVVSALHLHIGQAVTVGTPVSELRSSRDERLEVVAFLPLEQTRRLREGMKAHIFTDSLSGGQSISAEVAEVAAQPSPPPPWFSRIAAPEGRSAGGTPLHKVLLLLDRQPDMPAADVLPSRIQIVLETVSPLALMTGAGSSSL